MVVSVEVQPDIIPAPVAHPFNTTGVAGDAADCLCQFACGTRIREDSVLLPGGRCPGFVR